MIKPGWVHERNPEMPFYADGTPAYVQKVAGQSFAADHAEWLEKNRKWDDGQKQCWRAKAWIARERDDDYDDCVGPEPQEAEYANAR